MIDYLEQIKEAVLRHLAEEDVSIGIFGSRVASLLPKGWQASRANPGSDVDIAVIPQNGWDRRKLVLLREFLEEMNVPYIVDLVDFSTVSHKFRAEALKHIVWWKP